MLVWSDKSSITTDPSWGRLLDNHPITVVTIVEFGTPRTSASSETAKIISSMMLPSWSRK